MGTRNLTLVIDRKGDLKVAQYGQWELNKLAGFGEDDEE